MGDTKHARIERLEVTNFQSLAKADIELGPFTVIVGPSNSGKSALLRALKAVVRNVNSPSAVRVGKNVFTATIFFDGTSVSIERGKSQSTYRVTPDAGVEQVYTKAGRTVPDDIQSVLALPLPDGTPDIVFSSQIDPPFLLAETGSVAAKILGDLTNVSRLHAASKEANRRRLEAEKLRKLRESDALAVAEQMREQFSDLPAHAATIKECREALEAVKDKAAEQELLTRLLSEYDTICAAEEALLTTMENLPKPADIEALAEKAGALLGERQSLLDSIDLLSKLAVAHDQLETEISESRKQAEQAEQEYHDVLVQAGTCPMCNQAVSA